MSAPSFDKTDSTLEQPGRPNNTPRLFDESLGDPAAPSIIIETTFFRQRTGGLNLPEVDFDMGEDDVQISVRVNLKDKKEN